MVFQHRCRQHALAALQHFEYVKTRSRAHRPGHATDRHLAQRLHEQLRIPVCGAQTQLAPSFSLWSVRKFSRQSRKVSTWATCFLCSLLRPGLRGIHHRRAGPFRNAHQDMAKVDRSRCSLGAALLFAQVLVNLRLAHAHLGFEVPLTQAL